MSSTTTTTAVQHALPANDNHEATEHLLKTAQEYHTKPLWAQMSRLNPPLPNPECQPHVWDYEKIRPSLLQAGELITEKQAERRVLMLVNPSRGTLPFSTLASSVWLMPVRMRPSLPILSTLDFSWSCPTKQLQRIAIPHLPADSSSRGTAGLLRFMVGVSRCSAATLSSRLLGTGTTMARTALAQ